VVEPEASGIEAALDAWLAPFLDVMGRVTRRRWAPLYLHGLLGPDGRKSLQPLAGRLGLGGHDQLQHFIASPAWDDAPLRRVLVGKAAALVGGPDAVLVVDDTALPKKGRCSVGVARQYCGVLGKRANCQALVSLTLARGEVPLPIGLRLFLPDEWAADPERCSQAGVPEEHRRALARLGKARSGARGDRPGHRRRRPLRPRAGGRRVWGERGLPAGPERALPHLGGRYPEDPECLPAYGRAALAGGAHRAAAQAPSAGRGLGRGRNHAGGRRMAPHQLAARHHDRQSRSSVPAGTQA
jgi:hypothetical protein